MDKNSFVLYASYQEHISLLTMEQRGVLLTAIIDYVAGQDLPQMDGMTLMAFSFIRSDLDRNEEKYAKVCETRREAGKMGGRPKANGFSEKAKKANGFFEKQTKAKKPDNDDEDEDDIKETLSKESVKKSVKRFSAPTVEQVKEYIDEKGYNIDPERFVDYYSSNGWMVGKVHMKDWKAAVRTWARSQRQEVTAKDSKRQEKTAAGRFANFEQRQYDFGELEKQILKAQFGG